jgi:two-component system chemotaxis response regulator CheB
VRTALNDQPSPRGGCRPSADVLFRSAAAAYGGDVVALVLTGMLGDGTAGLGPLKRAGAYVIAQDEASSVVWGMPGTAVEAGLVDAVLPLTRIPAAVAALLKPPGRR